jgi:antitoxin (DNA-binding transcriptional repressor) of toxin-antitoxin stability system
MAVFAPHAAQSDFDKTLGQASLRFEEFSRKIAFMKDGQVSHSEQTPSSVGICLTGGRILCPARAAFQRRRRFQSVAICGYNHSMKTGIRDLKDNLSQYIRKLEAGERVVVTAHGRVVAELVRPAPERAGRSPFDHLVASGVITPPIETGDPLENCPDIRLAPGTASALIDADRDEA